VNHWVVVPDAGTTPGKRGAPPGLPPRAALDGHPHLPVPGNSIDVLGFLPMPGR
jgi:hypothetical protein